MRHFIASTFGDGALILAALSVVVGLGLGIGWSAKWFWLCLPIIVFLS